MSNAVELAKEKVQSLRAELQTLPELFKQRQTEVETAVRHKLADAGLADLLEQARSEIERHRVQIQSRADHILGQIEALETIFGASDGLQEDSKS